MDFWHFLKDSNEQLLALSNIVLAIATVVLALGIPWSILVASREQEHTFYATLDRTYFEIQNTIIEHPHLGQPDLAGKTPEQIVQYNAFALNVWNFIEAIVDYSEKDRFLTDTWQCILRHEAILHRAWFLKPENRPKFKRSFQNYIDGQYPAVAPADPGDLNM